MAPSELPPPRRPGSRRPGVGWWRLLQRFENVAGAAFVLLCLAVVVAVSVVVALVLLR